MAISFDFRELDELTASFEDVPASTRRNVRAAVEVTARGIRDDWRAVSRGMSGRHARAYPFAVTYDLDGWSMFGSDFIRAEIGPDLARNQGTLGFLEEGVGSQNTAAQGASKLAVEANRDDFIRGILMAAKVPGGS